MAKAPRPGCVKTRLAPMLGPEGCASLQAALITLAAAVATSVAPGATVVAFDPPDAEDEIAGLVPRGVELVPQRGGHLGERLTAAVTDVHAAHRGPLVVVGSDIPLLSAPHLRSALAALAAGADVVLGPSYDGGYYLAGMNRPEPSLFDIPPSLWGGPDVLAATLARVTAAGLRYDLIEQLRDLDTPADALALAAEDRLPSLLRPLLRGQVAVAPGEASYG
jgi:rSAM/selenodomain-associated transferase 1